MKGLLYVIKWYVKKEMQRICVLLSHNTSLYKPTPLTPPQGYNLWDIETQSDAWKCSILGFDKLYYGIWIKKKG